MERVFAAEASGDTGGIRCHAFVSAFVCVHLLSDVSADVLLKLLGEHFFVFCKQAGYDTMLRTLGGSLVEFIGNLDALHSYLALSYQV